MVGGAEKVLINLVNNLDFEKYEITVQTLFDYGVNKTYLNKNIKYKYIFKKIFRGNIYLLKLFSPKFLFKKMIKGEYDIIISYLEGPTTRIVSGCSNKNVKLVNWVHTELKDIKEFKKVYRNLSEMKKCYLKYHKTIFVSLEVQKAFENIINVDSLVIPNVIDINTITESSQKENLDIEFMHPAIVTIGRLTKVKGYERLLRIHKRLIDENVKNYIYLLGEGEERQNIEKIIHQENLSTTVKLMGYKKNPYVYIKNADLYVCSSYKEGYNTALVEAIILGKPVITTKCSGVNDILNNGRNGMIVENNDEALYEGLKRMILDEKLRKSYEEQIAERKLYFDTQTVINKTQNFFDKI